MSNARQPSGLMETIDQDNLSQLKKELLGEDKPTRSLNYRVGALSDKDRNTLVYIAKQALMMMRMKLMTRGYSDETYDTVVSNINRSVSPDLKRLVVEVLEELQPVPVREQPKKQYNGSSIYDDPSLFPQSEGNFKRQSASHPKRMGRYEARKLDTLSQTVGGAKGLPFRDMAFRKYKDTIAKIESSDVYDIRGGYNKHYLGRYQLGRDALKDVGIGYSEQEQQEFLSNPAKQDDAFTTFTQQNHEYLLRKSSKYRDMGESDKLAMLGYAHNQGRGGALRYLETGETQKDGFGTDAQKYIDEVKTALGEA